jgi:hypothetical protein
MASRAGYSPWLDYEGRAREPSKFRLDAIKRTDNRASPDPTRIPFPSTVHINGGKAGKSKPTEGLFSLLSPTCCFATGKSFS